MTNPNVTCEYLLAAFYKISHPQTQPHTLVTTPPASHTHTFPDSEQASLAEFLVYEPRLATISSSDNTDGRPTDAMSD